MTTKPNAVGAKPALSSTSPQPFDANRQDAIENACIDEARGLMAKEWNRTRFGPHELELPILDESLANLGTLIGLDRYRECMKRRGGR